MKKIAELIIYPLIVGVIVAIVAFGLPLLTQKDKKLEFTIDSPTAYISPNRIGDLNVVINGVETKNLNSYNVKIENTGDLPLIEIPVKYIFSNLESGFKILTEFHRTIPPYEFGDIQLLEEDSISLRYQYDLINPGDIAELTILTTKGGNLNLYAKQEGLTFQPAEIEKNPSTYIEFVAIGLTAIGAFLSTFLKIFEGKKLNRLLRKLLDNL